MDGNNALNITPLIVSIQTIFFRLIHFMLDTNSGVAHVIKNVVASLEPCFSKDEFHFF